MTLNINIITPRLIVQSSDFRITRFDTQTLITDESSKYLSLTYSNWRGLITYTGVGLWDGKETSKLVEEWVTPLGNASFEDFVETVRSASEAWLAAIAARSEPHRHTFIVAAFQAGASQIATISNFERCNQPRAKQLKQPSASMSTSTFRSESRPLLMITGRTDAVSKSDIKYLRQVMSETENPQRIRAALKRVNSNAARSDQSQTISDRCAVVSLSADGTDVGDIEGQAHLRTITYGISFDLNEVLRADGLDPATWRAVGFTAAVYSQNSPSNAQNSPSRRCRPATVKNSNTYTLRELRHLDFESLGVCAATNDGLMTGGAYRYERRDEPLIWRSQDGNHIESKLLRGFVADVNGRGQITGRMIHDDGKSAGFVWEADLLRPLCGAQTHASGHAINVAGVVAGSISTTENDDPAHYVPAVWTLDGRQLLLSDLGALGLANGQAIDINDDDHALVIGQSGKTSHGLVWNIHSGNIRRLGSSIHCVRLLSGGGVLGTYNDKDRASVSCIFSELGGWRTLELPAGFEIADMNSSGVAIGRANKDGYTQGWVRTREGGIIWLPSYVHHTNSPGAITESGIVVGNATSDHGSHALVWEPTL